jgi:guanylate kinase
MSSEPLLIIISSPSGAGKSTLTGRLRERVSGLKFSVSHTTRQKRQGEVDGREYHFVSRETFERLIQLDEFLEWALVHGNLYGTSKKEVDDARGARGLIFDIDQQGARQIKSVHPDAVSIFILPPSMQVLESRLRGRATEDEASVQRRFHVARTEIEHYGGFEYLLVNDDLEEATLNLVAIFRAEECRRERKAGLAERLLAESRRLSAPGRGS